MKLTIGLASFNNLTEVWFTVQSLRMHHDLTATEILVLDNYGSDGVRDFIVDLNEPNIRYVRWTEVQGSSNAKDRAILESRGEWVLFIDSHVLLPLGVVSQFRDWCTDNPSTNLYHGVLVFEDLKLYAPAMKDEWRGGTWGIWDKTPDRPAGEPYSIPMHGMGLFATRKDSWIGFNPNFRGYGGEEGYIHTKYRRADRDVMVIPFLEWTHFCHTRKGVVDVPYPLTNGILERNYRIGFEELGLDQGIIDYYYKPRVALTVTFGTKQVKAKSFITVINKS